MADYTSPKPVDPIFYQPHAFLQIRCRCGRSATYPLAQFAKFYGLPRTLTLRRLIARLRCQQCKARPEFAEVTKRPGLRF